VGKLRKICKIEIKNEFVVKGIQLEGVRKISTIESAIKKATGLGAEEIFLVDNTRSLFDLYPNFNLLEKAAKVSCLPITFGGGIRSLKDAMRCYEIGASRVYINSALAKDHNLAKKIAEKCGKQSLSGGVEYRSDSNFINECFSESGREPLGISVENRIINEAPFVGEFILTSITRDGTFMGPDLNILKSISIKKIPIVICGGINLDRDLNKMEENSQQYRNFSGYASSSSFLL